jgi:hypothetical protein
MTYSNGAGRVPGAALALVSVLFLTAGPAASQQAGAPPVLDAVGGNSANGNLLWPDFENGLAVVLNDDANQRTSLKSFGFFKDLCDTRMDVVAADTNRGQILLYRAGRGTATELCTGSNCPLRPDGISLSDERLMSVVDTGTAGTTPTLWLFQPAECGADPYPFGAPVPGGQFRIVDGGAPTPVVGLSDTEFTRVPGGGLDVGDLLVLTASPATIARVRGTDIADLLDGTTANLPPAQVLVDETFFGSETATGMAFVPGTGGIGSATDAASHSEDLLIALSGGRVLKLAFEAAGGGSVLAPVATLPGQSPLGSRVFVAEELGNGPLGIAAGIGPIGTYMAVADRQRGRFIRFLLDVDQNGELSLARVDGALQFQVIEGGVQNPEGVAINSDVVPAADCRDDPGTPDQTGCRIRNTLELHYTQSEFVGEDTIIANFNFLVDPRGAAGGELTLTGLDFPYRIPDSCRGFPLPDDAATSLLIVVDINKNFELPPGDFRQVKELADVAIPQLDGCKDTGARIYYHPSPESPGNTVDTPEQGEVYDTTFFCSNPSRSLDPGKSLVVICADPLYLQAKNASKIKGALAKALQGEIGLRAERLTTVVNRLPGTEPLLSLREALLEYIALALQEVKKGKFANASAFFDAGALAVYDAKAAIVDPDSGLPASYYAEVFGRFLPLAFFSMETAAQLPYCPPARLRDDNGHHELVDVDCGE